MTLEQRIRGCLYAGAAGDALGYAVEFDDMDHIVKQYGPKGIRNYDLNNRHGKAIVSDDTQMTLFTAEGMVLCVEKGEDMTMQQSIHQAYCNWLGTQGGFSRITSCWHDDSWLIRDPAMLYARAPGNTCLNALGSGEMGDIDDPINNSKGCGAVMRTAVCGFAPASAQINGFDDDDTAAMIGAQAGAMTHSHPMGWIPAAMLADIIYRITYKPYTSLPDVVLDALGSMQRLFRTPTMNSFVKMIRHAVTMAVQGENDADAIRELGGGWVGDEALAIAVYCAIRHENDLIACLRASVNHSGDSDSTGAIAGNILGCWLGIDALPEDWREPIDVKASLDETARRLLKIARPL